MCMYVYSCKDNKEKINNLGSESIGRVRGGEGRSIFCAGMWQSQKIILYLKRQKHRNDTDRDKGIRLSDIPITK